MAETLYPCIVNDRDGKFKALNPGHLGRLAESAQGLDDPVLDLGLILNESYFPKLRAQGKHIELRRLGDLATPAELHCGAQELAEWCVCDANAAFAALVPFIR